MPINTWEFLVLGILALVILGPDKLPRYAADAARTLRHVRQLARDARTEVRRELGPEFDDVSLRDLNPRSFVSRHLLDDEDDAVPGRPRTQGEPGPVRRQRSGSTAYDADDAPQPGAGGYGDVT